MSAPSARVRSGRSPRPGAPVVAVTAPGSPVGRALVAGLTRARAAGRVGAVVGVDDAARLADGVPLPDGATAPPDVVVHVAHPGDQGDATLSATAARARAVRSVQDFAAAAAACGAHRLVVVTSAVVHGVQAGREVPLPDDAPVAADRAEGLVGDLLEVERIVARLPKVHPGLATTVVRPAVLAGPGVDTIFTRHLRAPRLLALRGEQMLWQFCHVDDLADAVALAVGADLDGPLGAGGRPWLTDTRVEQLTGARRVELPARFAFAAAERMRRAGTTTTTPADLAFVVHPWVVGAERLTAAGWAPRYDAEMCLRLIRAGLPGSEAAEAPEVEGLRPREAALGAAGAAVAILGTAALLRQARARRAGRPRPRL